MTFSVQYAYFFLDALLIPFWIFCFLYRKDLRRSLVLVGLAGAAIAALFELFFWPHYWHPISVYEFVISVGGNQYHLGSPEDVIWGFLFGGIAATVYEILTRQKLRKKTTLRPSAGNMAMFFVIGSLCFIVPLVIGVPVVYSAIISCFVCGAFYTVFRRDLLRDMIISGFSMGIIYFVVLFIFSSVFKDIFQAWWNMADAMGIYIWHIPLEEVLIASAIGVLFGPAYEYFLGFEHNGSQRYSHQLDTKRMFADAIFLLHCAVAFIVLFGWAFPSLWLLYMSVLAIAFSSDILLGYCFLSKWEFAVRKQVNPTINYDYSFTSFYTYKIVGKHFSSTFIDTIVFTFLGASLGINAFFHFLM